MSVVPDVEEIIAPTPKDTVLRDGTAQLYHFRPAPGVERREGKPVLLVPSMINRWYVLDLREGASVCKSLVERGLDTWLLDWGIPEDEDRYRTWDEVIDRLHRMVRRVKRETGADSVGLMGYCMGGTLCSTYTALHPENIETLVNLTGPIDFSEGGLLRQLVDDEWFDPEAITEAGNLAPNQMQSGFVTLRPTGQLSKWILLADKGHDPEFVDSFMALETWVGDNIPFPASAYVTYIKELYQQNLLAEGDHWVNGERVDLGHIECPLLNIAASRDTICPPRAARALNELASSEENEFLEVPGGHVGAVVGSRGPKVLYPQIVNWFELHCGYDEQGSEPALSAVDSTDVDDDDPTTKLVRKALASDNYNTMRSALSQVSDEPAVGDKASIRERLEAFLAQLEQDHADA
jgi:polyhydroxyalkanoate synthase